MALLALVATSARPAAGQSRDGDPEGQRIQALQAKIPPLEAQRRDLVTLRERVRLELQAGRYCSECQHSESEITRSGEDFNTHLRRVGGKPVAAPQDVIDRRMGEFDDKIAEIDRKLLEIQDQINEQKDARTERQQKAAARKEADRREAERVKADKAAKALEKTNEQIRRQQESSRKAQEEIDRSINDFGKRMQDQNRRDADRRDRALERERRRLDEEDARFRRSDEESDASADEDMVDDLTSDPDLDPPIDVRRPSSPGGNSMPRPSERPPLPPPSSIEPAVNQPRLDPPPPPPPASSFNRFANDIDGALAAPHATPSSRDRDTAANRLPWDPPASSTRRPAASEPFDPEGYDEPGGPRPVPSPEPESMLDRVKRSIGSAADGVASRVRRFIGRDANLDDAGDLAEAGHGIAQLRHEGLSPTEAAGAVAAGTAIDAADESATRAARDGYARERYGRPYDQLTSVEQGEVADRFFAGQAAKNVLPGQAWKSFRDFFSKPLENSVKDEPLPQPSQRPNH